MSKGQGPKPKRVKLDPPSVTATKSDTVERLKIMGAVHRLRTRYPYVVGDRLAPEQQTALSILMEAADMPIQRGVNPDELNDLIERFSQAA